jgi:RNA polymerase sigma-70 factor, ECF subfamily
LKLNRPRDNARWIEDLSNPPDEEAIAELRSILVRCLKPALYKYVDRELEEFGEDVARA